MCLYLCRFQNTNLGVNAFPAMVEAVQRLAGVPIRATHAFRRTFIKQLLNAGNRVDVNARNGVSRTYTPVACIRYSVIYMFHICLCGVYTV